jgi:SP family galactose:H+ symporter-like MFS transporter
MSASLNKVEGIPSREDKPAGNGGSNIFIVGGIASLAGLMFGLDVGSISGAQVFIQREFHLQSSTLGWIVSAMMLGAALGALACAFFSNVLGRKRSLLIGGVFFVAGAAGCAYAGGTAPLILWRIVLGFAVGIASYNTPLYIAEIAPPDKRGTMVSSYQLMVTVGILLAFISDSLFAHAGAWRWMLGIMAFPGIVFVIGIFFLPYSPAWLMTQGRKEDAYDVLMELRDGKDAHVKKEIRVLEKQTKGSRKGFAFLFSNANPRRALLLGILLAAMQQLTGINVVMYYAPKIFQEMGYTSTFQLWLTAGIGAVNVVFSIVAMKLVDSWGRKKILYLGFSVMALSLLTIAFMLRNGAPANALLQSVTVGALMVFIAACAVSASPVIWVLCAEVQPLSTRNLAVSASTVSNWTVNMLVGGTFPFMLTAFGASYSFGIYAALNAAFVVLTATLIPETQDVELNVIEENLMSGKPLRLLGEANR